MPKLTHNGKRLLSPSGGILNYTPPIADTNRLTEWTNSIDNPYETFTLYDRSSFNVVNTGGISRVFTNEIEIPGYGFSTPQAGLSLLKIYITWNSGTGNVALALYKNGSFEQQSLREYNGESERLLQSYNIIWETASYKHAVYTTTALDITITNASWEIINGTP